MDYPPLAELLLVIGHPFNDLSLLEEALTHASYANEAGQVRDYQRLEFLGDAVLELVVSDMLLERFPEHKEGDLSRLRASSVNGHTLAALSRRLGLGPQIRMSHGEEKTGGRDKETILADVFEALVGAVYRDAGLGAAACFVERFFDLLFEDVDHKLRFTDYKTRLQEVAQAKMGAAPLYRVVNASGPDHDKLFVIEVLISKKRFGRGEGKSKKEAEQQAAKCAYEALTAERK